MIEDKIQKDVPLAPMTTFKIGGPAKYFLEVKYAEELAEAVAWAKKNNQKIYIMGGGSNLLIADEGLDGLVLKLTNNEVKIMDFRFHCGAGASLAYAISLARRENLSGLEWGFGIPSATIGGSVRGNAGGFGEEMAESVETVEAFNIEKERFQFFSHKDIEFEYRTSIFKKSNSYIIWGVTLKLKKGDPSEINSKIENNLKQRDSGQPRLPNAGCIFKNLFIADIEANNPKLAEMLKEKGKVKGTKVGVGLLIDMLGFKGRVMGGAKVSLEHANFIVNTGKATAKDVLTLIEYIRDEVKLRFKLDIEPEVQVLGIEKK